MEECETIVRVVVDVENAQKRYVVTKVRLVLCCGWEQRGFLLQINERTFTSIFECCGVV